MRDRWHICGYKGTQLFFETEMPKYSIKEIEKVLQRLVAKTLDFDEIVKESKRNGQLFRVNHENREDQIVLSCGHNPYFLAVI